MKTTLIIALITSATAIAAAAKYAASRLAAAAKTQQGSKWYPFLGFGIQAVKITEQAIPDGTPNTSREAAERKEKNNG